MQNTTRKMYLKSKKYPYPFTLTGSELIMLVDLLCSTPGYDDCEVAIYYDGKEVAIKSSDATEFLKHEDLPDKTTDVSIEIEKSITRLNQHMFTSVSLYNSRIRVGGTFQSNVLGEYESITQFIDKRRNKYWILNKKIGVRVYWFVSYIPAFTAIYSFIKLSKQFELLFAALCVIGVLTSLFFSWLLWSGRLTGGELIVRQTNNAFNRENIVFWIMIMGFVFTAIGTIATIVALL